MFQCPKCNSEIILPKAPKETRFRCLKCMKSIPDEIIIEERRKEKQYVLKNKKVIN